MSILVIVESPAKAKTINKFLGDKYKVVSSVGHIRDLPKKDLGVDVENNFAPSYVIMDGKEKIVAGLIKDAKKADRVLLAADPDREGEAICFHLYELIKDVNPNVGRILFNEITKKAILQAVKEEQEINYDRVDAQQARRIVDRIMGYEISPLLWKKVKRGVSAGRVQSVGLKIICEREELIRKFISETYSTISSEIKLTSKDDIVDAKVTYVNGERLRQEAQPKSKVLSLELEEANKIVDRIKPKEWTLTKLEEKKRSKNPPPPFITSQLQQTASFTVSKTMRLAQQLYEGMDMGSGPVGLITYMRTDSVRVSDDAIADVRSFIGSNYDAAYLPATARAFKGKKGASVQDGHEAIRPTSAARTPAEVAKFLEPDQLTLYRLIWNRFVASQMAAAIFSDTTWHLTTKDDDRMSVKGQVKDFAGFETLFKLPSKDQHLPAAKEGAVVIVDSMEAKENTTKPPARYSEATLVKALEENGIGRPSTYASILTTLISREYVMKVTGRFHPTAMGIVINMLLQGYFNNIIDEGYTSSLEDRLDEIAQGKAGMNAFLAEFYKEFSIDKTNADENMPSMRVGGLDAHQNCPTCEKPLVIKVSKYGPYLSCSAYPDCEFTQDMKGIEAEIDEENVVHECPKCGADMDKKKGRFGPYLECTRFTDCQTRVPIKKKPSAQTEPVATGEDCPDCSKPLVEREGRFGKFISCSGYPKCKYIKNDKKKEVVSTGVGCPLCKKGTIIEKNSRRGVFYGCDKYPKCKFTSNKKPIAEACDECQFPVTFERITKRDGHEKMCTQKECGHKVPFEETKKSKV